MKRISYFHLLGLAFGSLATAQVAGPEALIAKYQPLPAPAPAGLLLRPGDRLAICGDSITEQKMYSRLIETYLTVCVPELGVSVRQYGWSGETAGGFLARMTNDCLRFQPTVATTCYGMNDHRYWAYEEGIGRLYREKQTAIVRAFKAHGARVVLGSPGCVSKRPEALNLSLCRLRNLDIEIARAEGVGFADVFWPMFTAGETAMQKYGSNYMIAGKDTVHPGWAGHLIMAYAFLKALGLDGHIGTFTVDLQAGTATVSPGHELLGFKEGELEIRSARYPVCGTGDPADDTSLRSGMALVPFNAELNRLMLVVKNASAPRYKVSWGEASKTFTAAQLAAGVNLADEFEVNPFSQPFARVDAAVQAKQDYETRQIKLLFHGPEFAVDPEAVVRLTEAVRTPLAEKIRKAFVPVTHRLRLAPE